MKTAVAALLGVASAKLDIIEQSFLQHLTEEGLSYGTKEEYQFRFDLFKQADAEIEAINADPENTFTVGHNMFSTWTHDEYKKVLGYKGPQEFDDHEDFTHLEITGLESSVDWRQKGAVNAVKNQKQCGSCWAFSATASIEGHHAIQTGKLLSLSEQQIVDCDRSDSGCNGGWQANAMKFVESNSQELESEYPYTGRDGRCHEKTGHVKVTGINKVQSQSVSALKAAIAKGPTSVTVEADRRAFQSYRSGILNTTACGTQLDHAITAVGYGTKNGQDYYIVRNSWGSSWGERGYINIAAVPGSGICGIQQVSVYPKTS